MDAGQSEHSLLPLLIVVDTDDNVLLTGALCSQCLQRVSFDTKKLSKLASNQNIMSP